MTRRQLAILALAALIVKAILIVTTSGTMDALMWDTSAAKIRAEGGASVYRTNVPLAPNGVFAYVSLFNHPPFMVHALRVAGSLAERTGTRVRDWIRLCCILADVGALLLVSRITSTLVTRNVPVAARIAQKQQSAPAWPLALVALSPVQILISGFHANTDPVMVLFVVSALYLLEVRRSGMGAGLALGAALCIKIAPILLIPGILAWLTDWKARFRFLGCAAGLWVLASLPWILEVPGEIIRNLLGYRSLYGWWGLSAIFDALRGQAPGLNAAFVRAGGYVVALIVSALGIFMARRTTLPLFCQCGVVMCAFVFLTPGFGVQYLSWLTPWLAVVPAIVGVPLAAAAGTFLVLQYLDWQGGAARALSERIAFGQLTELVEFAKATAWLSILAAGISLWLIWRSAARLRASSLGTDTGQ